MYYAEVVEEGVATNKALEIGIDVDEMAMCPDEDTGGLASVEDNGGEKAIDETAEKEDVKDADEFAIAESEMPKTPGVPLKTLQFGHKTQVEK
jgi:hypothetical protein